MVELPDLSSTDVVADNPLFLIIVFVIGLVFAFYGASVMKAIAGLIGAILGSTFAYQIALYFRDQLPSEAACLILAAIIGALIGAFLAIRLMKMLIVGFFGLIGFFIGMAFTENLIIAIITAIVLAIIVSMVINQFLAIITALLGGLMVGYLALIVVPEPINMIAFLALTIIIGFIGARYQLKNMNK
jgi:hypothetical protein